MHLTIITADDRTFFMEIDPSMLLADVRALVGAEAGQEVDSFELVFGGEAMRDPTKAMESYGLGSGEEVVQMM
jgi:hypothetical protein